ncbi:hypothetical protein ACQ5SO_00460 [Rhodovulum sp. DZ06]|uniref:hypothetical protein n=1 Tax=Rhodovulum sp. DZ06 TaxID=3425126 RepID=UPI003D34EBF0
MTRKVPKGLYDVDPEAPEQVGAKHGEATGAWRILRNSAALCAVALLALGVAASFDMI